MRFLIFLIIALNKRFLGLLDRAFLDLNCIKALTELPTFLNLQLMFSGLFLQFL